MLYGRGVNATILRAFASCLQNCCLPLTADCLKTQGNYKCIRTGDGIGFHLILITFNLVFRQFDGLGLCAAGEYYFRQPRLTDD